MGSLYNKLFLLQKEVLHILENYNGNWKSLRTDPLFTKYNILEGSQVYHFKLLQLAYKEKLLVTSRVDSTNKALIHSEKNERTLRKYRTNFGK